VTGPAAPKAVLWWWKDRNAAMVAATIDEGRSIDLIEILIAFLRQSGFGSIRERRGSGFLQGFFGVSS